MIVMSRKKNESVVIGNVTITIVEIRGDKVRLGIDSPPEVPIHRREVYEALRRELRAPEPPGPPDAHERDG